MFHMFCMFYMCSSAKVIYCYLRAAVSMVLHLAVLLRILLLYQTGYRSGKMEPEKKVTGPSFEISMPFVYPSNVCDVVPYFRVVPRIMQQPEEFLDPQNAPKSLAAGALPQAPLGELTVLPQTP